MAGLIATDVQRRQVKLLGVLTTFRTSGGRLVGFTALAQGLLTDRYLEGIPEGSRASQDTTFDTSWLTEDMRERLRGLNEIAGRRGQTLAQLALAWALRDERVTSLVIGASSIDQLDQNVDALDNLSFDDAELAEIDGLVGEVAGVDLWAEARVGEA